MIRTKNLSKIYSTGEVETVALCNVNLSVQQGEFVAVMGPSGCGKTTLLNVLGLIDSPSNGEYVFLDYEVSGYSEHELTSLRKKNIGFVFQSFNLIEELTVFENVELPLLYLGISAGERRERVLSVLDRSTILFKKNNFPQQLSGGQQQLAAIARAIVAEPVLILADEPTGNLDSSHGKDVMNMLSGLNESGTTIVMVTHSPEYAEYSRRIIHLFDGHVVSENIRTGAYV
ncbi:ABC transporter ATP-binding protein [bacterium]|nr:ABC transporter ATP-binding protein [bacterium]